ncbi:MAG: PAS domain S-box protein [Nitrospirae bacterium]|nr:PAS domain S-box protein [Nitrospirota bacterium]
MEHIYFKHDLDVIYFVYGLSFFIMGYSILTQYKPNSVFTIGRVIWLLGLFGIFHGISEWLDMWAVIKGSTEVLEYTKWAFLVSSYCFLLEFGFRMCLHNLKIKPGFRIMFKSGSGIWLTSFVALLIVAISSKSSNFWTTSNILSRYFMGFTGSVLTGVGFIAYYHREDEKLRHAANMKFKLWALAISFFIYALLSGLIVPRGSFFPANMLNVEWFRHATNLPARLIRGLFIIVSSWNIGRILSVFQWETNYRLEEALDNVRQSEVLMERTFASLDQAVFLIYPASGAIMSCNPAVERVFGYKKEDIVGHKIELLFVNHEMYHRLGREIISSLDVHGIFYTEYRMRKKDGTIFFTEITVTEIKDKWGKRNFFVVVIRDISHRKAIEEELIISRKQLRSFALHLQSLIEKERTSFARELHDEIGQALTSLKIDIDELSITQISQENSRFTTRIDEIKAFVDTIIDRMHKIASDLRPSVLDQLGLLVAMQWQAKKFSERTDIQCNLRYNRKITSSLESLGPESSTALFRIFQEALTNVCRHSNANKVNAYLYKKEDKLIVKIVDDGVGIGQDKIFDYDSLGLLGMRERANVLGWNLEIKGKAGTGTVVKILIPGRDMEQDAELDIEQDTANESISDNFNSDNFISDGCIANSTIVRETSRDNRQWGNI